MKEFKSETDPIRLVLPTVALTAAQAAVYGEVPLIIKAAVKTHKNSNH
jgi:hypothetical protein